MSIRVALHHRTQYRYDRPVTLGPHLIFLRPTPNSKTPILSYELTVKPSEHLLKWQFDVHHNYLARVLFSGKTDELTIDVNLIAQLTPANPFDFLLEPEVASYPFAYAQTVARDLETYLVQETAGPRLKSFLASLPREHQSTVTFLVELARRIRDEVAYVERLEPGIQSSEETLASKKGSCRDSAWLLVQVLRHIGIASRFVSGYLIQLGSEEGGSPHDSAELHAWAEAYLPGAGWIGLDTTSGLLTGEGHIPLMCTPDAAKAAPISGTAESSQVDFSYLMSVQRLDSKPNLVQPLTSEQWGRLQDVAHRVDDQLQKADVRLTMGGEPTFVGIDDPESPEWNLTAVGPHKLGRGFALIQRIRERIAPGGLLHYGQGKWYPGEPLPRWALSCYWRSDGVPIWESDELIARNDQDYGFSAEDAERFVQALARRLQVRVENILPAYNPGSDFVAAAGYILPIRRRQPDGKLSWSSQLWFNPPDRLVLSPGDSPIGYRIPVELLPWVAPDHLVYELDAAPHEDRARLPAQPARRPELFAKEPPMDMLPPILEENEGAAVLIRPALCVESRAGRIHVFLPFIANLADFLDLVTAIEDTCKYLQVPIWLEGYTPPPDPRMRSFSVTPDPGVLEVNLPSMREWDELVAIHTMLFEEARANRLAAEKFTWEGNRVATGGGNHITLGGATVADSPFLRRPDLLRSMIAFWQNHPSLSYLFSGMYVGPTSQSPRVDEARMDALYELEVAFQNLPVKDCPAWVIDGLFRNLLVDVTGNAHRAEFCVDKLYPPEGTGSRLGLLELRAFEMAPHVQMNLATLLLVRALVATLWKSPFTGSLVRWGTALHDRFLLPHFIRADFIEVLAVLRRAGYAFEDTWFAAQFAFRFPRIGAIVANGVELELCHALEPWNVLAEETTSGGTVRTVDSSLERVQVRLLGMADNARYIVLCNGRRVPLKATGAAGELVGGVRFRARQLSAALHPTIPVHSPLVFDMVDQLTQESIARCAYHALSPAGRIYTRRPADIAEADQRRSERFTPGNPPPGRMNVPPEENSPLFPLTLDLRLPSAHTPHQVPEHS